MKSYRYRYTCPGHDQAPEDGPTFGSNFDVAVDPTRVAEDAASHYHYHGNGLDSTWPKVLELRSVLGHSLGLFSVEREAVPEFYATKVT